MQAIQPSKPTITQTFILDDVAKTDMLGILGIVCDTEGYLVYKESGQKALSLNGREMKKEDFGGVIKGSTLLMRADIDSLLNLAEKIVS